MFISSNNCCFLLTSPRETNPQTHESERAASREFRESDGPIGRRVPGKRPDHPGHQRPDGLLVGEGHFEHLAATNRRIAVVAAMAMRLGQAEYDSSTTIVHSPAGVVALEGPATADDDDDDGQESRTIHPENKTIGVIATAIIIRRTVNRMRGDGMA